MNIRYRYAAVSCTQTHATAADVLHHGYLLPHSGDVTRPLWRGSGYETNAILRTNENDRTRVKWLRQEQKIVEEAYF